MNEEFVKLVNAEYDKLQKGESCFYIGEGNPDANILIIGNECAIDNDDYRLKDDNEFLSSDISGREKLYRKETAIAMHNVAKWKDLLERKDVTENLCRDLYDWHYGQESDDSKQCDPHRYYPLFPWFGQKCSTCVVKKGKVIRGQGGTARTWVQYQKLINATNLFPGEDRNIINFHSFCFHTELSQIPLKSSSRADKKLTGESIRQRLEQLFTHPFFRKFPVIIVAAGHYPRDYKIDMERVFNVKFDGNFGDDNEWINMHHGNDYNSPRLLIHTRHLAGSVSDDYIERIAGFIPDIIGITVYEYDAQRNVFASNCPRLGNKFEISKSCIFGRVEFPFIQNYDFAELGKYELSSGTSGKYYLAQGNTYAITENGIIKYKTDTVEITKFYPQRIGYDYNNVTRYDVVEYAYRDGKIAECLRELERGEIQTLTGVVIRRSLPGYYLSMADYRQFLRQRSKSQIVKIKVSGDNMDSVTTVVREKMDGVMKPSEFILVIKVRKPDDLYTRDIMNLFSVITEDRQDVCYFLGVVEEPYVDANFSVTIYMA